MYAVFQSGGKQHRVSEGQVVRLEKLELATGATVEFDSVLMVVNGEDVKIGAPVVCLLYTSPSPRDRTRSRMPSSA